jgi:hypothetical protein
MFITNSLFWIIIGLGIGIPATVTIIINVITKVISGDNYDLSVVSLFKVYLVALIGWSIFFSEVIR